MKITRPLTLVVTLVLSLSTLSRSVQALRAEWMNPDALNSSNKMIVRHLSGAAPGLSAFNRSTNRRGQQSNRNLLVTVIDGTGVPVASARVVLIQSAKIVVKGETDYAGRCELTGLSAGLYQLRVEKEGFYAMLLKEVNIGETETVGITLNHEQEVRETIDVTASPPAIDPTKTAASENLNAREIVNIPYPATRDFRNILTYIPGVSRDSSGQIHVNGSASYQTLSQLDGFNISHPVTGLLDVRLSPDALRSIEVQGSRYSAEYGKGSGGVLNLTTAMGDDRYRYTFTDFIPSFQTRKGVHINNWTPRATFSGPILKHRAWFFDAIDGEYGLDIIKELPSNADRSNNWRLNNLTKAQINLNQTNILTGSFLINRFRATHAGLSLFNPIETTRDLRQAAYIFSIKEQSYLSTGLLLEVGFGVNQFDNRQLPLGRSPYTVSTERTGGNFYKTTDGVARRYQWIANLTIPPFQMSGRHELRTGVEFDRITFQQLLERRPISILRTDGSLSRTVTFNGESNFTKNNFATGGYLQDRWTPTDKLLMEFGLRLDRDTIVRQILVSPRIAATYLPTRSGDTKLTAGVGIFYDPTNLSLITRSLEGQRFDQFYAKDGRTPINLPVETSFDNNGPSLKAPRFINWSLGVERKLPSSIYLRAELIEKRGTNGLTFVNRSNGRINPLSQLSGLYELSNDERDRYKAVSVSLRRAFKSGYEVFASYTRSSARSNAIFDYSLDRFFLSQQAAGPLSWDTPNRFISYGWLPLIKGFDLGYSLEWRDGFPFSLVNQDQQLVGEANSLRFPAYFSLNTHAERRFHLLGLNLALRAGFNNLTNRKNPSEVNNNVDSPKFLNYSGTQSRAFVGRVRFLGRK